MTKPARKRSKARPWDEIIADLQRYIYRSWDVEEWLQLREEISEELQEEFPKAKEAAQLRKSKLYKALK
jgi:hypothetical protein